MPKRKYAKKRRKFSRKGRRRRRRFRQKRYIPYGMFPKRAICRLKYAQFVTLDPGVTANSVSYSFRANCVQDPNYTGAGHQPKQFDEIMALYKHFTVLGSKIKVTQQAQSTTELTPCIWGVDVGEDPLEHNDRYLTDIIEDRNVKRWRTSGLKTDNRQVVVKRFSAKKWFGVPKVLGSGKAFTGTSTASPSDVAYFNIWATPVSGNDPGNFYFMVEIEYIVAFTEPDTIPQS